MMFYFQKLSLPIISEKLLHYESAEYQTNNRESHKVAKKSHRDLIIPTVPNESNLINYLIY